MPRIRQHNVTAAQWSPNGEALGSLDLTKSDAYPFGENVFSAAVQKERLSKDTFKKLQNVLDKGEALDSSLADEVAEAMKEWALEKGATHFTHVFQPLTGLTAEKHDSFFGPEGDGTGDREVQGLRADPGRAGRFLVPDRWRPRHLRGARLHRLGPHQPGVHPREPERRAPLHPDGVRVVDGRGARRQDPAPSLDGRALALGDPGAPPPRRRRGPARLHDGRPRAGVLPDRRAVLLRASRPASRPGARCSARSRRRATSSTTTTSGRSRSGSSRACSTPRRRWRSWASRSRPATTRSRRRSTRSRRSSRTRTSVPTISSS